MKLNVLIAAVGALLALAASPAFAEPTACPQHYAGAQAPKIIEGTLSGRLKEVCKSAFGVMHSGATKAPLWSSRSRN